MKVDKIPKGTNKKFATGGKQPMLGTGDRTRTANPATPQKSGRTGQHPGKVAPNRAGKRPVDEAGSMGGSGGVSMPRRPAA